MPPPIEKALSMQGQRAEPAERRPRLLRLADRRRHELRHRAEVPADAEADHEDVRDEEEKEDRQEDEDRLLHPAQVEEDQEDDEREREGELDVAARRRP